VTDPPRTSLVRRYDTHRLISSRHSEPDGGVLARIADDDRHLADILDLDNGTDDRLLAESELLPGIGVGELVFGVPYYRIVNAAFTHAHPLGSRFNGPERGAWYAAFEIETAQTEIAFHTRRCSLPKSGASTTTSASMTISPTSAANFMTCAMMTSPRSSIPKAMSNLRR